VGISPPPPPRSRGYTLRRDTYLVLESALSSYVSQLSPTRKPPRLTGAREKFLFENQYSDSTMTRDRIPEWKLGRIIQPLGHSLLPTYVQNYIPLQNEKQHRLKTRAGTNHSTLGAGNKRKAPLALSPFSGDPPRGTNSQNPRSHTHFHPFFPHLGESNPTQRIRIPPPYSHRTQGMYIPLPLTPESSLCLPSQLLWSSNPTPLS